MPTFQRHIFVCVNERAATNSRGCCARKGGEAVRDEFKKQVTDRGLKGQVRANKAGCLDQCEDGVTVVIYPEQVWYGNVTVADVAEIVERHVIGGEVVSRLLLSDQPHLADAPLVPLHLAKPPATSDDDA